MLKRISFWTGVALLTLAVAMMVSEKNAIHQLKQSLSAYGGDSNIRVEGARLYLDGLAVKRVKISDQLILKNVLFGRKNIKHVDALEITIDGKENLLTQTLPFGLYDHLNIQFVTIRLPFFDETVSLNGRLQPKKKSDGGVAYTLNFMTEEGAFRTKGVAVLDITDQKINQISVTFDKTDTRYDWLKAKRVTGWWDYNGATGKQSGEVSIGSLEWQNLVFDNVQITMSGDEKMTFSSDLPKNAGQVDGDLTWNDQGVPQLSMVANVTDLKIIDEALKGEGDFSVTLSLKDFDPKVVNFNGVGDVKGRLQTAQNTVDFDYVGGVLKQGETITLTPDDCFNASATIKRGQSMLSVPSKTCLNLSAPLEINGTALKMPMRLSAKNVPYILKGGVLGVIRGTAFSVSTTVHSPDDISIDVPKSSVTNAPIKGVAINTIGGHIRMGQYIAFKDLTSNVTWKDNAYVLKQQENTINITDPKTSQKIAELSGRVDHGFYTGKMLFNGALSRLNKNATGGQAFYNGSIGFDLRDVNKKIDGQGLLKITDGAFQNGDLTGEGTTADLQIESLVPLVTKPNQRVEIKNGTIGSMGFSNAFFHFTKQASTPATIHGMQLNAMGVVWQGDGLTVSSKLPVDDILKNTAFDGLKISPNKVTGYLNFDLSQGIFTLKNSVLKSSDEGFVRYDPNMRPQFLNTGADYYDLQRMRDILLNFKFTELAVPMDKNGVQGLYIKGTNPHYNMGKPIAFDLTVD